MLVLTLLDRRARSNVSAEVRRRASSSGQRWPAHGAASAQTSADRGAQVGGPSLRMERHGHGPRGDLGAEQAEAFGSRLAQSALRREKIHFCISSLLKCKLPLRRHLLDRGMMRHSAVRDALLRLHCPVGVSLIILDNTHLINSS
jgi:hypothetical protein